MGIKLTLEQRRADGGHSWFGLVCFGLRMRQKVLVYCLWSSEWCYEWLNIENSSNDSKKNKVKKNE
jgi:hypothetical protein